MIAKFKYISSAGNECVGQLSVEDYQQAAERGVTVRALINMKYPDASPELGSAWDQGVQSLGIRLHSDPVRGIRSSTIGSILDGTTTIEAANTGGAVGGTLVSPSQQGTTPATRVFFPELVMQMMDEVLQQDYTPEQAMWSRMIASNESIPETMYTQPYINVEAPGAQEYGPISQNALPEVLVSIETSQRANSVPTMSIGLQISEQAMRRSSIDLVGLIVAKHAREQRLARMWSDINKVWAGNLDTGDAALSAVKADTLDSGITAAGALSQLAWLTMLLDPTRAISIDSIICDLNGALAIQNRSGRPLMFDPKTSGINAGNAGDYGLNVDPNILNVAVGVPNVLVVPTSVIGANNLLMFDSQFALRRVTSVSASYQAMQEMILQRTTHMRFDFGDITHRLYDDAFRLYSLTLT